MADYSGLPDDKLKTLTDADDRDALYETAVRYKNGGDLRDARKFFTFAAMLGQAKACVELGKFYDEEGIADKALELYMRGYELGDEANVARLAELMLGFNEEYAVNLLTDSAVSGNAESIAALEKYYSEAGNDKEAKFWKGKRDGQKK